MPTRAGVVCVPPVGVGSAPFIGLLETERVPARTRLAPQDLLGHFEDIHVPFGTPADRRASPESRGSDADHRRLRQGVRPTGVALPKPKMVAAYYPMGWDRNHPAGRGQRPGHRAD